MNWRTVEDVCGPLAGPSTAVGAALEQVRRRVTSWSPRGSRWRWVVVVVTVGVRVAALDAACRVAAGCRLRRTGARSDRVHSAQEPAAVPAARPAAAAAFPLQPQT